jgi:hypothetical protein
VWGQCIEVSVGPYKDASYPFRRPTSPQVPAPALVRVCATEETYHAAPWLFENAGLPDAVTGRARVGQRSGGANRVQVRPRVDGLAEGVDFTLTGCDRATVPPPETAGGFGAVGASWLHRAGETLATLFAPRVAWAGHGGLSGLPGFAEQTSVFGPVDPFVFQATFTGDAVGGPPTVPDLGRGSWTIDTTQSPGSVLVRSGIGDIAGNVAVIDQAGGAAGSKAGAALLANLAYFQESVGETGVRATTGRYRLRWTSLVATPRAFGAPFHAFGPDRAVLARVSFENGRGAGSGPIHFNGSPVAGSDGQPLRWTQNRKQRFELLVDLDAGRAELRAAPFVDESAALASGTFAPATPLVQAGWLLGGIDAQIIGTDDWEIVQLPARLTPR